ncbi:MAG TPA: esterase, partial [Mycobacterium sp.]|nr:esterase [Mycobacterium sp.]
MPSLASRLVPVVLRLTGRGKDLRSADAARGHIADRALRPLPYGPPRCLGRDIDVTVSHDDAWPVYTVAPTTAPARHRAVYVHGGGWVNEIDPAHWRFVAELAVASQTAVRVPI